MQQAFAKTGKTLQGKEVSAMFTKKKGQPGITYEEFSEMMRRTAEKGDEHIQTSG